MDNAAVADGTALKRVYIPTEYSFNTGNVVPGVYGSKSAARFILDAVNNVASLDCLWVGDSNTGYNGFGWCDGFQHGLCQAGSNMYATPIVLTWNTQPEIGYRSNMFQSFSQATSGGLFAGTGASSGASSTLKATYGVGSGSLSATGQTIGTPAVPVPPNFLDIPGARTDPQYSNTALWAYMRSIATGTPGRDYSFAAPCPIAFDAELNFRLQVNARSSAARLVTEWGVSGTGFGQVSLKTRTAGASPNADVWEIYTHTMTAGSRFVYSAQAGALDQQKLTMTIDGATGQNCVLGPISLGFCSIYQSNKIGTSNSIMEYRGGANLTEIATDISQAAAGWCKTLLKEARERQIAANPSGGRVLICIQGGVNSTDWSPSNPAAAITAVESIKTSLKAQWAALGYPATDLYFLFMVSHSQNAGDTVLTVLRTYAQAYYTNSTDTLFVNLNDIAPYEKIRLNGWYQYEVESGGVPAGVRYEHLSQGGRGYETISSMIVNNICRFA
jgi:hypothetical protein